VQWMKENGQPAAAPRENTTEGEGGDSQDQWHRFLGLLMKGKAMQQTVGHQPM
jgi:hypothetical protein